MYICVTFSSVTSLEAVKATVEPSPVKSSVYTFDNTEIKCTISTFELTGTPVLKVTVDPAVV